MNSAEILGTYMPILDKYKGEYERKEITAKDFCRKNLVVIRIISQKVTENLNDAFDVYNALRRMQSKYKYQNIQIKPLDMQCKVFSANYKAIKETLASVGAMMAHYLDCWQLSGASYNDFFNFYCCSESTKREMLDEITKENTSFSGLAFIYSPDYKYNENIIKHELYAPITHCIKEYYTKVFVNACKKDKNLNNAALEEAFELFPEIRDSAIRQFTDEFGDTYFTDIDGLPLE